MTSDTMAALTEREKLRKLLLVRMEESKRLIEINRLIIAQSKRLTDEAAKLIQKSPNASPIKHY